MLSVVVATELFRERSRFGARSDDAECWRVWSLVRRVELHWMKLIMNEIVKDLPFHFESSAALNAPAETVFLHLDDHQRLSAHVSQSSWMMAGGRMKLEMDDSQGHAMG